MRSTCLAFATTAVHEFAHQTAALSEEALYWGSKQVDNDPLPGTTFAAIARALSGPGQPHAVVWPYDAGVDDLALPVLPPGVTPDSSWRTGTAQDPGLGIDDLRQSLDLNVPVVLGLELTEEFIRGLGAAIAPPATTDVILGQHAVLIVGYEPSGATVDRFLIRNSWGTMWRDGGYAWLPASYVQTYGVEARTISAV